MNKPESSERQQQDDRELARLFRLLRNDEFLFDVRAEQDRYSPGEFVLTIIVRGNRHIVAELSDAIRPQNQKDPG